MNSFIENVNYVANLDNKYGSGIELYKNNLSLKSVQHDIELKFSYYNNDDKKIHSIVHSEPCVLVGGIDDMLLSFKTLVESSITGSEFTCTVSSGVQNFVINNIVMVNIAIVSNNDMYKAYELEMKVVTAGAVTYDVFGEVKDSLKILPSLAMITSSEVDVMANVYEIKEEIVTVSENIANVETVSDSIANVNIVGEDIANVNTVASNIVGLNSIVSNMTEILLADDNAAIATTKALESSNSAAASLQSSLDSAASKNSAITKAAEAVVSANSASYSASTSSTKASEASASASNALDSENKAEKWAEELEDVEVEIGKYSAKHWAAKAAEIVVGGLIDDVSPSTSTVFSSTRSNNTYEPKNNNIQVHISNNTTNPHNVTKSQVGLSNVDNTSDIDKIVASAGKLTTSRTISLSGDATGNVSFDGSENVDVVVTVGNDTHTHAFVNITGTPTTLDGYGIADADTSAQVTTKINNAVSALVDSSPAVLDTLNKLAAALGDDPNFATTVANNIATKVTKNADITAGTATKVTYDKKGLVTGSTTISASDIPSLDASKITSGTLANARLANSGVTAGTYKSVTVDGKGIVTGGTNPTTLGGYGITDTYTKTETNTQISTAVNWLVDAAPGTLDTLNELAAALGDDPNFATTTANAIAAKLTKNADITAGTATKVTYDAKGLVTSGTTLSAGDIPVLDAGKITTGTLPVARGGTGVTTVTGTGSVVLNTSPILVTPNIGIAIGTSFNSITGLASVNPIIAGVAAVGTSTTAARQDHVHPVQTSVSGNAGTATKLATAIAINGVSFDGSANITIVDSTKLPLAGGTMTGAITAIRETKVAMAANNIDLATGNLFTKTISGYTTLTISNALAAGNVNSFVLELTNGGSAVTTWFSGVKWAGGIAPTLTASGKDILGFYSHDGGTTWNILGINKDVK